MAESKEPAKKKQGKKRVTVTLTDSEYTLLCYWADKMEVSVNEFLHDSIEHMIRWQNKDYDLPTMEVARLNQLIDVVTALSSNVSSLESVIVSGFESLLGLTRGDNYLMDDVTGGDL